MEKTDSRGSAPTALTRAETQLLAVLRDDARKPVAEIARELGLARATIQERIRRLEESGVIEGYTVRLNPAFSRSRVTAHSLVRVDARKSDAFYARLKKLAQVGGIYAISGEYDVLVVLQADTTAELDEALDTLGRYDGVERTQTSIVLSVKYER
jgi:DNA-binding Lrp family transcriptional regulator